ncbi:MAG: phosphonate utilization associated transcriptional regulator [Usitatibacter sp.]
MLKSPAALASARRAAGKLQAGAPESVNDAVLAPGTIAFVQASSLSTLVQKELERMIVNGELPAGEKLIEGTLAERLGVSRGPVREAFRGLLEAGLVRFEKNRGVYVRHVSVDEAEEIYEVRAALDEFAGRRLAQMGSPDAVRQLRALVERMEKAASRANVDAYASANLEFHDRLIALTGNAKLLATYRRLVNELNLRRRSSLEIGGTMAVSIREHREIVEKIAAGQVAAAGRALNEHAMESRQRMRQRAQGVPGKLSTK